MISVTLSEVKSILPLPFLALLLFAPMVFSQSTIRASLDSNGVEANGRSSGASISSDGRFIAFSSEAANLVPGDTNGAEDVFVRDRWTGKTVRVSIDSLGVEGDSNSYRPVLSADGRYVAFASQAGNLVTDDSNQKFDVFTHDLLTRVTERVSLNRQGIQGNGDSGKFECPAISADGQWVAFASTAANLVPGDSNGWTDVFLHDRRTGMTTRVSVDSSGAQVPRGGTWPSLSANGRFVAFFSRDANLVSNDLNGWDDVFVRDRLIGETTRISVGSSGVEGDWDSRYPAISADGRYVAFESLASNLIPGDTNRIYDVFVHDRIHGETSLVSKDSSGIIGDFGSRKPSISADGRFISFESYSNFVPQDVNGDLDIYLHDRLDGRTGRVSLTTSGSQVFRDSSSPNISANGRFIAFISEADRMVPNDGNKVEDVFVRDIGAGSSNNSIVLVGPFEASAGDLIEVSWFSAPPNSAYFLYHSANLNGGSVFGHSFDLGFPVMLLTSGINSTLGTGSYHAPPIPPSMAGQFIYLEMAATIGGIQIFDSIAQGVRINQ